MPLDGGAAFLQNTDFRGSSQKKSFRGLRRLDVLNSVHNKAPCFQINSRCHLVAMILNRTTILDGGATGDSPWTAELLVMSQNFLTTYLLNSFPPAELLVIPPERRSHR